MLRRLVTHRHGHGPDVAGLAVVALAAGCGSNGGSVAAPMPTTGPTASVSSSPPTSAVNVGSSSSVVPSAAYAPGRHVTTFTVDGVKRTAVVVVPADGVEAGSTRVRVPRSRWDGREHRAPIRHRRALALGDRRLPVRPRRARGQDRSAGREAGMADGRRGERRSRSRLLRRDARIIAGAPLGRHADASTRWATPTVPDSCRCC